MTKILKLPGQITILADRDNWILQQDNVNNRKYFSTLDEVCEELFEIRLKTETAKAKQTKQFARGLLKTIENTRWLMRQDMQAILGAMSKADSRFRKYLLKQGL